MHRICHEYSYDRLASGPGLIAPSGFQSDHFDFERRQFLALRVQAGG